MELVKKGDWDNPKEEITIYGKYGSEKIFALYLATDFSAFKKKIQDKNYSLSYMLGNSENLEDILKKQSSDKNFQNPLFVYLSPLMDFSEKDFAKYSEDVWFVGNYKSVDSCMSVVTSFLHTYITKMCEQFSSKFGEEILKNASGKDTKNRDECCLSYDSVPDSTIETYITEQFVNPLQDAARTENKYLLEKIQQSFLDFSKGTNIHNLSLKLCGAIRKQGQNQNYEIVDLLVSQIGAIKREEYEQAGEYKKQIDEILNKN